MKHTIRETNINIKLCNIDIYYLMKAQLILSRKIKNLKTLKKSYTLFTSKKLRSIMQCIRKFVTQK